VVGGVWANEFYCGVAGNFDFAFKDHLAIGIFLFDVVGFFVHRNPLAFAMSVGKFSAVEYNTVIDELFVLINKLA